MKRAKLYIGGTLLLPYQTAVKIAELLQEAVALEGFGEDEKINTSPYFTIEPFSDTRYQALTEAPIYGVTPDKLEEELLEFKRKPKFSIEDHPDLSS